MHTIVLIKMKEKTTFHSYIILYATRNMVRVLKFQCIITIKNTVFAAKNCPKLAIVSLK